MSSKRALSTIVAEASSMSQEEAARVMAKSGMKAGEEIKIEKLASLWSGMGGVYVLDDAVIVKKAKFSKDIVRNRDFENDKIDFERDIGSYHNEANFYNDHAPQLMSEYRLPMPKPFFVESDENSYLIAMEKLHGTTGRNGCLTFKQMQAALSSLAKLHAAYWGKDMDAFHGLATQGTYWYLDTRPNELENMPSSGWKGRLRAAAPAIAERLKADILQTCVHGDAKPANFAFYHKQGRGGSKNNVVAQMFDFQYSGHAPPTLDLAYLVCRDDILPFSKETELLQYYLAELDALLRPKGLRAPPLDVLQESIEIAAADYTRFLTGWGARGLESRTRRFLDKLDQGTKFKNPDDYFSAMNERFPPDYAGRYSTAVTQKKTDDGIESKTDHQKQAKETQSAFSSYFPSLFSH